MDITISLENLRNLLDQQKAKSRFYAEEVYNKSEFKKDIEFLEKDKGSNIAIKFYEIRDSLGGADYPDDFKVLQKYLMKDGE